MSNITLALPGQIASMGPHWKAWKDIIAEKDNAQIALCSFFRRKAGQKPASSILQTYLGRIKSSYLALVRNENSLNKENLAAVEVLLIRASSNPKRNKY